jgi:hypothetical protein
MASAAEANQVARAAELVGAIGADDAVERDLATLADGRVGMAAVRGMATEVGCQGSPTAHAVTFLWETAATAADTWSLKVFSLTQPHVQHGRYEERRPPRLPL